MKLQLPEPTPYTFPAISETRKMSVPMTFSAVDSAAAEWLNSVWKDMRNAIRKAIEIREQEVPKWMNWTPWVWCYEKQQIEAGRTPVLAWAEGFPVGFLTLWEMPGEPPVLYVEHIGVTPGDMPTSLWERRYHKVGWGLMAYAIHVSRENGFGGRVGLHAAADAVRESVYRKYEEAVPGLFLPDARGIPGPTPYGPKKNLGLSYLQTTDDGATRFLEGFRNA